MLYRSWFGAVVTAVAAAGFIALAGVVPAQDDKKSNGVVVANDEACAR